MTNDPKARPLTETSDHQLEESTTDGQVVRVSGMLELIVLFALVCFTYWIVGNLRDRFSEKQVIHGELFKEQVETEKQHRQLFERELNGGQAAL
jgi:hypothetical protein